MNPADAARRRLTEGDTVRVFDDRGQILAGLRISTDIRRGVIRISEGGWFDPVDPVTLASKLMFAVAAMATLRGLWAAATSRRVLAQVPARAPA